MGLRFIILKEIKAWGKEKQFEDGVLEYREDQIRSRLLARMRENLVKNETWLKHRWSKVEVAKAFEDAFDDLVREFKEETIRIQ